MNGICQILHLSCLCNMQIDEKNLVCFQTRYQETYVLCVCGFIKIFIGFKKTIWNIIVEIKVHKGWKNILLLLWIDTLLIDCRNYDCWWALTKSVLYYKNSTHLWLNVPLLLICLFVMLSESGYVTLLSFIETSREENHSVLIHCGMSKLIQQTVFRCTLVTSFSESLFIAFTFLCTPCPK